MARKLAWNNTLKIQSKIQNLLNELKFKTLCTLAALFQELVKIDRRPVQVWNCFVGNLSTLPHFLMYADTNYVALREL